jgi:hypothetical protein
MCTTDKSRLLFNKEIAESILRAEKWRERVLNLKMNS